MTPLDQKINTHFPGLVVRKDLVKTVKGNAIVPTYVLEDLLGQYCATTDEPTIQTGIETVREILRDFRFGTTWLTITAEFRHSVHGQGWGVVIYSFEG